MRRGIGWSLASAGVAVVGGILVTPGVVHTLGVTAYGLYVLVLATTSYASFLDLGLTWAATRYVALDLARGDATGAASRIVALSRLMAGVGLATVVIAAVAGPSIAKAAGATGVAPNVLRIDFLLAALALGLSLQVSVCVSALRGAQAFDEAGRAAFIGSVVTPMATYACIRLTPGVMQLLALNMACNLLMWGMTRRYLGLRLPIGSVQHRWRTDHLLEMARFGGWASASRVVMTAMLQVDRLAVGLIGSVSAITFYSIPANLSLRVNTVGSVSTNLFFSRASMLTNDRAELGAQRHRARRFLMWSTLAAAGPLILLGPTFLGVWIGPDMRARGGSVLVALAIGYGVLALGSVDGAILEALGRPDLTTKSMLAWSGVAITLIAATASRLGTPAIGYAVAVWLAGLGLTNMTLASRRLEDAPPIALVRVCVTLVAGAPVAVVLREFADGGVLSALVAMSATGATMLLVGSFAVLCHEDRHLLTGWLKRSDHSVALYTASPDATH